MACVTLFIFCRKQSFWRQAYRMVLAMKAWRPIVLHSFVI
jgi:hypothetical protein